MLLPAIHCPLKTFYHFHALFLAELRDLGSPGWSLDGSPWITLVTPLVMHVKIHIANPLKTYSLDGTGGPLGGPWMAASISLQQDGTGGAPGSKNAEEFQEGQQELQRTLNPPHPLLGALNPPRGKGG